MGLVTDDSDAHDVTVKRDEYVEVRFADGHVCRFGLARLRRNCPCAECRNRRELDQQVGPPPGSATALRIVDAQLVGAWGLGLAWNDGHTTGIYPWDALRRWCEVDPG